MGVGSTGQTELGRERVAGTPFVCPSEPIQSAFSEYAAPLHQLIVYLTARNANLRATRDLLLPKLVSMKLRRRPPLNSWNGPHELPQS